MTSLRFQKLAVGFKEPVLFLPDLSFNDTGWVSLYGHNGSGKSTLLKTLCGDISPVQGKVLLHGMPIQDYGHEERASRISFSDTSRPSLPGFLVHEVIGLHVHQKPDNQAILNELAVGLYLEPFLGRVFSALSDGEKQMVLVARAIHQILSSPLQKGRILLLDEPSSFLDYRNKMRLYEYLKVISRHVLVLMAGHDFETTMTFADSSLVVEKNCLIHYVRGELTTADMAEKLR